VPFSGPQQQQQQATMILIKRLITMKNMRKGQPRKTSCSQRTTTARLAKHEQMCLRQHWLVSSFDDVEQTRVSFRFVVSRLTMVNRTDELRSFHVVRTCDGRRVTRASRVTTVRQLTVDRTRLHRCLTNTMVSSIAFGVLRVPHRSICCVVSHLV
jgi:hypothetical protein